MSTLNDGGPAYPTTGTSATHFLPEGKEIAVVCYGQRDGMSLRDYFAAHETLGDWDIPEMGFPKNTAELLVGPMPEGGFSKNPVECMKWEARWRAALRYIRADAMIAIRRQTEASK